MGGNTKQLLGARMNNFTIKIPCGDALRLLRHNLFRPDLISPKYEIIKERYIEENQWALIFKFRKGTYSLFYTTQDMSFNSTKFLGEKNIDDDGMVEVFEVEWGAISKQDYYSKSYMEEYRAKNEAELNETSLTTTIFIIITNK